MCQTVKTPTKTNLAEECFLIPNFEEVKKPEKQIKYQFGSIILAILIIFLAISSQYYDFLDFALNERIKMRPGLPAFDIWKNPTKIDFRINIFIFAVQNSNEFLNGTDHIIKFKEIGPISYRKIILQDDILFHNENSTLSYTTKYKLEFISNELNDNNFLNQQIIVINPTLLSLAAFLYGKFYANFALNLIANEESIFIERTINDILWNCTTPMLEQAKKLPFMIIPRSNAGIMFNAFFPETTRFNVNIGPKHGYNNFFKINHFNGISWIKEYESDYPKHCPFSLIGATDGTGIPPRLSKESIIYGYQNTLCRTYPFIFNQTLSYKNYFETFKYVLDDNEVYKRNQHYPKDDCLSKTGSVLLPDGFSDHSKCAFGMPAALSNPHFWGFNYNWRKYFEGFNPNQKNHQSYLIIEPKTGIPLEGVGRLQMNIPMPSFDKYYPKNIQKFANMILPSFWMEWNVRNDDAFSILLVRIAVNFLPIFQYFIIISLWSTSGLLLIKIFIQIRKVKSNIK